jgi:carboxymethylenebutenolidase
MKKDTIDPKVYDLYDEYCHTQMTRRDFFNKASALAVVGGSGSRYGGSSAATLC